MGPVQPSSELILQGRYALAGVISSGGMATVHFGRLLGEGGFARTVAIKRLHAQFARDAEFAAMFLDEARIVARIRHPNVVPTIDVVSADGELFLVMELVEGESLSRLLRTAKRQEQQVPARIAGAIVAGMLFGLHAAHEAKNEKGEPLGIVHRDVTPHNVLVGTDGVPRLIDFGVAKAIGRLHATRDGALKGKIPYMPPEQVRSKGVDRRTDVYAAGVVLWETLTGRRLFDADDEVSMIAKVLEGDIVAPSTVVAGISPELDAVVMKALDRDAAGRFATAREMAIAIEQAQPCASAREVGEWVESLARETLEKRAAAIASIETAPAASQAQARASLAALQPADHVDDEAPTRFTPSGAARQASGSGSLPTASMVQLPSTGLPPELESGVSQLSGVGSITGTGASPARASRRGAAVMAVVAALVVAIGAGWVATRPSGGASTQGADRPAQPVASAPASAQPSAQAPGDAASAPASAPPSAPAPEASAPRAPSKAAEPAAAGKPTPAKKAAKADCSQPYVKGPDGIMRVRPECL